MAGDGGRVPDVSEQRARHGRNFPVDEAARLLRDGIYLPDYPIELVAEAWRRNYERCSDRASVLAVWSDPASVLAALLAESPEATVAAIEALLTTDEAAGEAISEFFEGGYRSHWCAEWQAEGRCQLCADAAQVALSAACRSLLSKAPKEDADA